MGIARNKEIYTPKWFAGLEDIPALTFTSSVEFWDKDSEVVNYNSATNKYEVTYTPSTPTPVPCRAQPLRNPVQKFTAVDGTWEMTYLISMHRKNRFDVQAGSRMKFVTVENNPSLLEQFFTVRDISDSDNSIEFTIQCALDTELNEQG